MSRCIQALKEIIESKMREAPSGEPARNGSLEDFLQERRRVVEAVDKRFAPILKQKEQAMSQQLGASVKIDPAMDPEYQKLLRDNLTILEDRYNQVLGQVKQELRRMSEV